MLKQATSIQLSSKHANICWQNGFFKNKYEDLQQDLQWQEAGAINESDVFSNDDKRSCEE